MARDDVEASRRRRRAPAMRHLGAAALGAAQTRPTRPYRERNTLISAQAEKQIVVTETHAKEQERIAYSLEAEMATFKNETVKQRKQIYQLEKERERYGVEAAEQRNLCDLRVLRCCGAFTPSTRLVSRNDGSGWFLFRF